MAGWELSLTYFSPRGWKTSSDLVNPKLCYPPSFWISTRLFFRGRFTNLFLFFLERINGVNDWSRSNWDSIVRKGSRCSKIVWKTRPRTLSHFVSCRIPLVVLVETKFKFFLQEESFPESFSPSPSFTLHHTPNHARPSRLSHTQKIDPNSSFPFQRRSFTFLRLLSPPLFLIVLSRSKKSNDTPGK